MNQIASPRAATAAGSSVASVRTTRITPSPPIPARRSHSGATCSAVSSWRAVGVGHQHEVVLGAVALDEGDLHGPIVERPESTPGSASQSRKYSPKRSCRHGPDCGRVRCQKFCLGGGREAVSRIGGSGGVGTRDTAYRIGVSQAARRRCRSAPSAPGGPCGTRRPGGGRTGGSRPRCDAVPPPRRSRRPGTPAPAGNRAPGWRSGSPVGPASRGVAPPRPGRRPTSGRPGG